MYKEKMFNNIMKLTVLVCIILIIPSMVDALGKSVFRGHVLDIRGNAVQGAEVHLYDSSDTRRPADFISAKTDDGGRFYIALPHGKYWAVARVRQGEKYGPLMPGDKHSGEPVEIEFERAGTLQKNFMVMDLSESAKLIKKTREGYFVITGSIVDRNGVPVSNVYAFANRGMHMRAIPDYLSAWTNEKGQYMLYMPEGRYYIGYASEFPPNLQNKMVVEIKVGNNREGLDIIADFVQEEVPLGQ